MFHLSLIGQLWWVLLFFVWVLCWLGLLLLHLVDQSLRSSYPPMTRLAQFRCHSCYDERSIDQKKNEEKVFASFKKQLRRKPAPEREDLCNPVASVAGKKQLSAFFY